MTVQKRQEIKFWSSITFSFTTLIFVSTVAFNVGEVKADVQKEIKQLNKEVEEIGIKVKDHQFDQVVHMPFEKKIEIFVPRIELESKFQSITSQLNRIEKKLDK